MTAQLPLDFSAAIRARDEALERVERVTSADFRERAERFVLAYLAAHGATPGEVLTDKGWTLGGLRPSSLKHWGPVFAKLHRRRVIHCVGYVPRMRGHGTAGGRVWELRQG